MFFVFFVFVSEWLLLSRVVVWRVRAGMLSFLFPFGGNKGGQGPSAVTPKTAAAVSSTPKPSKDNKDKEALSVCLFSSLSFTPLFSQT